MSFNSGWRCLTPSITLNWAILPRAGEAQTRCRKLPLVRLPQPGPACARFNSRSNITSDAGHGKEPMQLVIEKLLNDFEYGGLTRRQLAAALAALVSGTAQAAPKNDEALKAGTFDHVTRRVADLHKTCQFY